MGSNKRLIKLLQIVYLNWHFSFPSSCSIQTWDWRPLRFYVNGIGKQALQLKRTQRLELYRPCFYYNDFTGTFRGIILNLNTFMYLLTNHIQCYWRSKGWVSVKHHRLFLFAVTWDFKKPWTEKNTPVGIRETKKYFLMLSRFVICRINSSQ